jgi:hypothetical protein
MGMPLNTIRRQHQVDIAYSFFLSFEGGESPFFIGGVIVVWNGVSTDVRTTCLGIKSI